MNGPVELGRETDETVGARNAPSSGGGFGAHRQLVLQYASVMFAEEAHEAGAEGVRKAKRWLDATTRAEVRWIFPEDAARDKLTFSWTDGSKFVFDLGGIFSASGPVANQTFMAEVKNYTTAGGQGTMYSEYLARCYRAKVVSPGYADQFMWITWHPFSVTNWSKLTTAAEVKAAVIQHRAKTLGIKEEQAAEAAIDHAVCEAISERLWLLVLSDKHELLMLSPDDRAAVIAAQIKKAS